MTFTEAAVEVLRSAGKPLHYKKITEIAIEKNLLSHVGKTPETTMSSRLATMVKKDRGDAPILKVKPGVFALREFPEDVVRGMCGEQLGISLLFIPEDYGGMGGGAFDVYRVEYFDDELVEPLAGDGVRAQDHVHARAQVRVLEGGDVHGDHQVGALLPGVVQDPAGDRRSSSADQTTTPDMGGGGRHRRDGAVDRASTRVGAGRSPGGRRPRGRRA